MIPLVKPILSRHLDGEVRLAVTNCVVQVMRITMPHDPYGRKEMKEIFQLVVESFQGLSDIHNPSFGKVAQILESVAKLRACVIMLDLRCGGLILEMFYQF